MNRLGASSRSLSRRIVSPAHPRASRGYVDSARRSPMDAVTLAVATAPLRHIHYGSGQAIFSIAEKPGTSHCSWR
jgi:hypothetical protein